MPKNFTDFELRTLPLSGDYLVGYKQDGSSELRTTIKQTIETGDSTDTPLGRGGFGITGDGNRILIGPSSLFKYGKPLIYSKGF
jgi:hypothetical protein